MEEKKTCPACGGALEYDSRCPLGSRELELYLCPDCGRAELYEPEGARARRRAEEQEARDMISSVSRTIDETRENVYCDIPVVNAVLSEKDRLCHEKGITLTVDLALPAGLTVESIHLCSIFGNLLDNAIRGAEAAGAERPAVSLRSLREGDYLFLKVTNPSPPPQPPREGRGLGTQILTELAQRYGGDYQTEYKDGVFSAVVFLLV